MIIEKKQLSELKPAPYNARQSSKEQEKQLQASLQKFGVVEPIIFNKQTGYVVGGHFRLRELTKMGYKEVECVIVDLNEDDEKELNIRLNANTGSWDWDGLANNFDTKDLTDWGLDIPDFKTDEELEAEEDDFDTTPPVEPITVLGDLYEIGEHRLLCGDSTDSDQVAKLMNGEKADMVFTDPPYGIGYEYNSHKDTKGDEYLKFCDEWFNVLNIFSDLIIISTGWSYKKFWWDKEPKDEMVWYDKTKQSGGRSFYLRKTEPIFIFGKVNEKYKWDVFENQSNRGDGMRKLHTCPKPISLIADIIEPQTKPNYKILDIFLGSGTTMVASHQLKRKCYGMELDPKYCDVIVKRMIELDDSLTVKRNGIDVTSEFK